MAASKKPATTAEVPPPRTRVSVCVSPAHASAAGATLRRYRAGLGPFGREPVIVEAERWQVELLKSDPALVVTQVE
jgi:hypothetical protein